MKTKTCPECEERESCKKRDRLIAGAKKMYMGKKYGRLTPLDFTYRKMRTGCGCVCHCRCECGNEIVTDMCNLISGNTQSCGCIQKEKQAAYLAWRGKNGTNEERTEEKKKMQKNNTSGVIGVTKTKDGKFSAAFSYKNIRYQLGTFDTVEEAAKALKKARENTPKQKIRARKTGENRRNKTGVAGVSISGERFVGQFYNKGKKYYVGRFKTIEEAAKAVEKKRKEVEEENET